MVTNQSGLGRGLFTEADLTAIHEEMYRQLRLGGAIIDGLYYCPVVPAVSDKTVIEHPDRKPGPGMLLRAEREMQLDLTKSWMIGDSASDILAGRNAGAAGAECCCAAVMMWRTVCSTWVRETLYLTICRPPFSGF